MADDIIIKWKHEFDVLAESEIHTYSNEQEHNLIVIMAIHDILQNPYRFKLNNIVEVICRQLLDYYRSGEEKLKQFTIQFIPLLVFLHLVDKSIIAVQTLLVSLYNMETSDSKSQARVTAFRTPSIAQSSIYHDSSNLDPAFTAISSLKRWEECNTKLVTWGPWPHIDYLNGQNRLKVATALLFIYNQQLNTISLQGVEFTCKSISRLVTQGFNTDDNTKSQELNSFNQLLAIRIPISSQFLIELLHTVYFAVEKGVPSSLDALNEIAQRAHYEILPDVQILANAIENLLQHPSPILPSKTYSMHPQNVSKSMITNASFRTKKLPDDIPIQVDNNPGITSGGGGGDTLPLQLNAITEETGGEEVERSKLARASVSAIKHLPKIPGLIAKKHKIKQQSIDIELTTVTTSPSNPVVINENSTATTDSNSSSLQISAI